MRSSKLDLIQSFRRRVKGLKFPRQIVVSIINGIRFMKDLQLFWCDGAPADEGIEIDYLIPVFAPEEHNGHRFSWLGRLNQRQHFEKFIQCSEPAGKNHEGFRQ